MRQLFVDNLTRCIYWCEVHWLHFPTKSKTSTLLWNFNIFYQSIYIWTINPMLANVFEQFSILEQVSRINSWKRWVGLDKSSSSSCSVYLEMSVTGSRWSSSVDMPCMRQPGWWLPNDRLWWLWRVVSLVNNWLNYMNYI